MKSNKKVTDLIKEFEYAPSTELLAQIPSHLQKRGMVVRAIDLDGLALEYVDEKFKDQELCDKAFSQNINAIRYFPDKYKDADKCDIAVRYDISNIAYIPDQFKTKIMCRKAIKNSGALLEYIPEKYKDYELCELAVQSNASVLQFVPDVIKDEKICDIAMSQNGNNIQHVPTELFKVEYIEYIINSDIRNIIYIPSELRNEEICKKAVCAYGELLQYVPYKTKELCEIAVKSNVCAVKFVPTEFMTKFVIDIIIDNSVKSDGELILYPFKYIPKEMVNEELVLKYLAYKPKTLDTGLISSLSDEGLFNAIELNDEIISLIPKKRFSDSLIKEIIENFPSSIEKIPEKVWTAKNSQEVFNYDHKNILFIPQIFTDIKMWLIFLNDPYIYGRTDEIMSKMKKQILNNEKVIDALIKKYGIHNVWRWINENKRNISKTIEQDVLEIYRGNSIKYDISCDYEDEYSGKMELSADIDMAVTYQESKTERNNFDILYITDIHLEHQLKDELKDKCNVIEEDIIPIIDEKIEKMLKVYYNQKNQNRIILIGGDVSHSFQLTELFYRRLAYYWTGKIAALLGNHELWDRSCDTVDNLICKYKEKINSMYIYGIEHTWLLNNDIYYINCQNRSSVITEKEINEYDAVSIRNMIKNSPVIILGGIGFAGKNPKFNAENGIYREMLASHEEEKILSDRFLKVYKKLKEIVGDLKVIIFTHMPFEDWCEDAYNPNWIYINGHTHKNIIRKIEDKLTVFSDNQIGYQAKKWQLKRLIIDSKIVNLSDIKDGIHPISKEKYINFNREKGIILRTNGNSWNGSVSVLKKGDLMMFVLEETHGLYLLEGGKKKL